MAAERELTKCDLENVDYVVSSEMRQETFAFVWTLTNFQSFVVEKEVLSPLFHGGPKTNHVWQLIVEPRGSHYEPITGDLEELPFNSFAVSLRLKKFGKEYKAGPGSAVNVSFQTSLLNGDDETVFQQGSAQEFAPIELMKHSKRQHLVFSYADPYGDLDDVDRDLNMQMTRVLVNDTLKLHCRIWMQYKVENLSGSLEPSFEEVKDAKIRRFENLAGDLQRGTEANSDVSLVTKTKTFRANKFILASRSPIFRTMFLSPWFCSGDAAAETVVKIDEFDADDVSSMLEFMYTGATPVQSEKAMELFKVADYYGLDGLKEDCLDVMGNDLKIESAVAILALAHLHDYTNLKTKVFNFMNRNKKEIVESEEFKEFAKANPAILLELYMALKN